MRFFYTIVSQPEIAQNNPFLSLGGFKSSSGVPNTSFNSLFSDLSSYLIQKSLPEYIGLILENTFNEPVKDIKIYIPKIIGYYCKYRLAIVELSNNGEMEIITTINSKPLYAEFYETDANNKIELTGEMKPGSQVGLWVERSLDMTCEELVKSTNCDYLFQTKDIVKEIIENVSLKVDFDYAR